MRSGLQDPLGYEGLVDSGLTPVELLESLPDPTQSAGATTSDVARRDAARRGRLDDRAMKPSHRQPRAVGMEQAKPDIFLGHLNSSTDLDPVSMDQRSRYPTPLLSSPGSRASVAAGARGCVRVRHEVPRLACIKAGGQARHANHHRSALNLVRR